jgi:hypothetical protein
MERSTPAYQFSGFCHFSSLISLGGFFFVADRNLLYQLKCVVPKVVTLGIPHYTTNQPTPCKFAGFKEVQFALK